MQVGLMDVKWSHSRSFETETYCCVGIGLLESIRPDVCNLGHVLYQIIQPARVKINYLSTFPPAPRSFELTGFASIHVALPRRTWSVVDMHAWRTNTSTHLMSGWLSP